MKNKAYIFLQVSKHLRVSRHSHGFVYHNLTYVSTHYISFRVTATELTSQEHFNS